ncbi:MAG: L-serine ammonia-lyase, partial [Hyphomicrobiales bacterium]
MISIFELFKIGIGPSSSHTVGPMKAAFMFAEAARQQGLVGRTVRLRVDLFGSLAWTGKGHGTDKAVILGLAGMRPETVDADAADATVAALSKEKRLAFGGGATIDFDPALDIVFDGISETPQHPNTLAFAALDADGAVLLAQRWCSVGGHPIKYEMDKEAGA